MTYVFYNTQLKEEDITDSGQNTKQTIHKTPLLYRKEDIQHVQEGIQSDKNIEYAAARKRSKPSHYKRVTYVQN